MGKFDGSDLCMNSDDFFSMEELPESMIFVGGGYIGCELACIMQALGVQTTIVTRSKILKQLDDDISQRLLANLKHLGVTLMLNSPHKKVTQEKNGSLTLHLVPGKEGEERPNKVTASRILLSMGRPPNVGPLELEENTGVKLDPRNGSILVDEFQNTSVEGVYSVGDICSIGINWSLTPVAVRAGRILSERLFNGKVNLKMSYENIATVIFSHPPIASVGLTEREAIERHGEEALIVYRSDFINMFYSPAKRQEDKIHSYFKLVCLKTGGGEGPAH